MDYIHEFVTPATEIPVKIFINSVKNVRRHWHNSLEINLVLEGEIILYKENQKSLFQKEDIIFINSNQIHSLEAGEEKNLILTIQIPKSFLASMDIDLSKVEFKISRDYTKLPEILKKQRSLMADIAITYLQKERFYIAKIGELIYQLIYHISYYFSKEKIQSQEGQEELDRLSLVINEIQNNYNTNFTLNDAASVQGLSRNYFASFFKKHMGITFLEYLNSVRLEHAHKELVFTKKTITEIALDNGFPNSKSFAKTFKYLYKKTPSSYRNDLDKDVKKDLTGLITSYFNIEAIDKFEYLYEYLEKPEERKDMPIAKKYFSYNIDVRQKGEQRRNDPLSLITFGRASTGLSAELQKQLTEAQREIGFKFVRFHGMLDDDMGIYSEDDNGTPIYNFQKANALIDFLHKIKLRPILELAFMPSKLAKVPHTLWNGKSYISMPKSMTKWSILIEKMLKNFIERYGIKEVLSWKFEVWNEPEYQGIMWNDSDKDFFSLWENTYKTIKKVDKNILVGGPSIFINTVWTKNWFDNFFNHTKKTKTEPDFLTVHCYPLEGLDFTLSETISGAENLKKYSYDKVISQMDRALKETKITISKDVDFLKKSIIKMKKRLEKYNWGEKPVFLTEWNSTTWQRDLTSDTTYKSSYIVKNILENINNLEGFGYWVLSDCMEEINTPANMFHGGFGLMTVEGIKKPGYFAFLFLKKLGNIILSHGENYTIFKDDDGEIKIIIYNYIHLNNLYRKFDTSNITERNRYNVFENAIKLQVNFSLNLESDREYIIRKQTIKRESGSAFDVFLSMGAPDKLNSEDILNIKKLSVPKVIYETIKSNQYLEISHSLEPHEVCLIVINKK